MSSKWRHRNFYF